MDDFDTLIEIMSKLRSKDGCPWDKQQSIETMKESLREETKEVIEAIDNRDYINLKEELGDLLFNVIFICQITREEKLFSIEEVLENVRRKLIRRHPHVFGDEKISTPEEVSKRWAEIKKEEFNGFR
jgi:MazG family protein